MSVSAGRGSAPFDLDEALPEIPGGMETALELAVLFLEECPTVLGQMRRALGEGDARAVRRGAHTLKSSAGIFAAHDMVEAASRLEMAATEGDPSRLGEPLAELEREAARVTEGLKRLCAGG